MMVAQQPLIEKNKAIRLGGEVYYKTTFSEFLKPNFLPFRFLGNFNTT
jgi:hypothetical protein